MADAANDQEDELLRAIGALVVNFGALEESMHDAILVLSGIEQPTVVNVLTAGSAFRVLVEKFGALCKELGTARVPEADVKSYCDHLGRLNDRRNAVVHSAWNWLGTAGTRRIKRSAKISSGFSLGVTPMTAEQVMTLADEIREAELKLWEVVP